MKEWMVLDPNTRGIFIAFPQSEEHDAREWMREHDRYIKQEGSPLHGATLELVEFETREERIERERARYYSALEIIADPSTACMTLHETVACLRAHARNALRG